jgi:hypothetical protein
MTLEALRARLAITTDVFKSATILPVKWKSLNSGTLRELRFSDDHIYGEMSFADPEKKTRFATYELKKAGDHYSGVFRQGFMCQFDWLGIHDHQCKFEAEIEVTAASPSRI